MNASKSSAYYIVRVGCAFTFTHELGHILGMHHNIEQNQNQFYSYGHGLINTEGNVSTIMSYRQLPGSSQIYPKILFWSNGEQLYNGYSLGNSHTSDNRRVLLERAPIVSSFMPEPEVIKPVLNIQSAYCLGQNFANWTSVPNAQFYQVWFSASGGASEGVLLHSGEELSEFVSVPSEGQLAVRACDSASCGAFSNSIYVNYYSLCL